MRTAVRARRDARGFSFVELLVTIVIAGIVFAALVPVFVMAAKKSGQDNSRNIAVNIAQGRLEKIRGLQYDQILADSTHLNDATFANGQFKTPYEYSNAGGTKLYWIKYDVNLYPSKTLNPATGLLEDTVAGKEDYKQVQVRVSWAPSEATITPENSVTLRTIVYKQYAGPAIIGPPRIVGTGSPALVSQFNSFLDPPLEYPSCVKYPAMLIQVDVDPNKASTTLKVIVGIYSATGELIAQIPDAQVVCLDSFNHWQATWTAPDSVNDGSYVIRAVAMSTSRYLGNTASKEFQLDIGPPGDVSGLKAWPANNQVMLEWGRTTAGDLHHYEIWRSLWQDFRADPINTVELQSNCVTVSYTDTNPNAGDPLQAPKNGTLYWYKVVAVDIFDIFDISIGKTGKSAGVTVSATPTASPDVTPPYPPTSLVWSASGKVITLSWTASAGDQNVGTFVSGLGDYYLYQSASASGPWTQIWFGTAVSQTVTYANYNETQYFKVTAKDRVLNESSAASSGPATSGSAPTFNLIVKNSLSNGNHRYVRVHADSLDGTLVGSNTGWYKVNAGNSDTTNWRNLVVGKYYVEWSDKNSDGNPSSDFFSQLSSAAFTFTISL